MGKFPHGSNNSTTSWPMITHWQLDFFRKLILIVSIYWLHVKLLSTFSVSLLQIKVSLIFFHLVKANRAAKPAGKFYSKFHTLAHCAASVHHIITKGNSSKTPCTVCVSHMCAIGSLHDKETLQKWNNLFFAIHHGLLSHIEYVR